MHPDLVNNPTFLRYYRRWQADPTSAAFVGVADFLRQYRLYADARRVCEEGLRQNPHLISARLVLARICLDEGAREAGEMHLRSILERIPQHAEALRLLGGSVTTIRAAKPTLPIAKMDTPAPIVAKNEGITPAPWATVTMARLYERQGYRDQAATIYRLILERDPRNHEAIEALEALAAAESDSAKA